MMPKDSGFFGNGLQTDAAIFDWFKNLKKDDAKIDLKAVSENVSKKITPQFLAEEQVELDETDDLDSGIRGALQMMVHAALTDDLELFESAFEEVMLMKIVKTLNYIKEEIRAEWIGRFSEK